MERKPSAEHPSQKRKPNHIFDLNFKRSIGAISSIEFKRRAILNQLNDVCYASDKSSKPNFMYQRSLQLSSYHQDDILAMEVDPRESRYLLVVSKYSSVAIFDVSQDDKDVFPELNRMSIPRDPGNINGVPNSTHWLWDGSIFSMSTMDAVYFWDSHTCKILEVIRTHTNILNHVMAAKKYNTNKFVAVTGEKGDVLMIDMNSASITSMNTTEKSPTRAIDWHPSNEVYFVTGNDSGSICLWDVRLQSKFVIKFNQGDSFSKKTSYSRPIIGLRFYNDGNRIISVDQLGGIKTWEVSTGCIRPNHYEPVLLCDQNKHKFKDYQFAVTDNLKEDIVFLPTVKGLRMFDIESGEHLPNSSDVVLPMHCATYDARRIRIYSAHYDLVKLWSTEYIRSDDVYEYCNL